VVAVSMALFLTFQPDSGIFPVIASTMLMGLGMANVMAPCTDSIMGSLPRAKAGVGSAVNDTTRQMGGAVGVAVFGSIMASHFTSSMSTKLGGVLPPQLFGAVRNNVGQAIGIAHQSSTTASLSAQISRAAGDSFVGGLHIVGLAAAGVTLLAALGIVLFLPARPRDDEERAPVLSEPVAASAGVS